MHMQIPEMLHLRAETHSVTDAISTPPTSRSPLDCHARHGGASYRFELRRLSVFPESARTTLQDGRLAQQLEAGGAKAKDSADSEVAEQKAVLLGDAVLPTEETLDNTDKLLKDGAPPEAQRIAHRACGQHPVGFGQLGRNVGRGRGWPKRVWIWRQYRQARSKVPRLESGQ